MTRIHASYFEPAPSCRVTETLKTLCSQKGRDLTSSRCCQVVRLEHERVQQQLEHSSSSSLHHDLRMKFVQAWPAASFLPQNACQNCHFESRDTSLWLLPTCRTIAPLDDLDRVGGTIGFFNMHIRENPIYWEEASCLTQPPGPPIITKID